MNWLGLVTFILMRYMPSAVLCDDLELGSKFMRYGPIRKPSITF